MSIVERSFTKITTKKLIWTDFCRSSFDQMRRTKRKKQDFSKQIKSEEAPIIVRQMEIKKKRNSQFSKNVTVPKEEKRSFIKDF